MKRKSTFIKQVTFVLSLTLMLITACATPTPPPQEPPQPFSARSESADGAIVAWSGFTSGYEPGGQATFDITIQNATDQVWHGRFCLQLMDGQSPRVITTLAQRPFSLELGLGFSEAIEVQFPEDLEEGAYGLSTAVRRPSGPMVDLIPIQIGETEETRQVTTQQDMDASLAACPPVEGEGPNAIVELAKADLAQRLDIDPDEITVQSVEPTEFPDASLGVPEPGTAYAQVVTPGYIIDLAAAGQTYRYHASDARIVAVPEAQNAPPDARITIESVEVIATQVIVQGSSNLPAETCVNVELWADGVQQAWWPTDTCVPVKQGNWRLVVVLESEQALQPDVQYMVRAYQPGGPDIAATFPFDLSAPPALSP
jgi:hypothetical protein